MNIAIFNSFPFHYEVMGFFIYYCFLKKYNLTIFTTATNNYGWIDFYYLYFQQFDYHYKVRDYKEFNEEFFYLTDKIIVITDDDPKTPMEFFNQDSSKFVIICHNPERMKPHYTPIFPFSGSNLYSQYIMPVFPIDLNRDKYKMSEKSTFKILLIGHGHHYETVLHPHKDIEYIWISREKKKAVGQNYVKAHTFRLMHTVKHCDFILYPSGHEEGATMSGSLPLAISTCTPILFQSDRVPKMLKLKNYMIYDPMDSSLIHKLRTFQCDYDEYKRHRNMMISSNIAYLDHHIHPQTLFPTYTQVIHFMWISDDPSQIIPERYRSNVQTFKNMNPQAHIIIWNKPQLTKLWTDFDEKFLTFFNNLSTNIQKADLSRYLIIYLFGGLYVDLDFYCVYNLHDLFKDKDVALFFEPRKHAKQVHVDNLVCNGILYSKSPRHHLFLDILEDVRKHFASRNQSHTDNAFFTTGPKVITAMYRSHPALQNVVYDSHWVMPICDTQRFSTEKKKNMNKRSYIYTLWKEGHWNLGSDAAMIPHDLEYYINNPDQYIDSQSQDEIRAWIIVISVIVCLVVIVIAFLILTK